MIRLLVVTLLLAAVAIALKMRGRTTTATKSMKIISRAAVNRGAMLLVVEVDGRRLLIGAGANQINLITELEVTAADESSAEGSGGTAGSGTPIATVTESRTRSRIRPITLRTSKSTGVATCTTTTASSSMIDKIRGLTVRTVEPGLRLARDRGTR